MVLAFSDYRRLNALRLVGLAFLDFVVRFQECLQSPVNSVHRGVFKACLMVSKRVLSTHQEVWRVFNQSFADVLVWLKGASNIAIFDLVCVSIETLLI